MNGVKRFFGVLLLAVALWIVSPVIPAALQMLAWAALLIGSGIFLRAIDLWIDFVAGPTEILIVAAEGDPRFLAADMLAQAEHDVEGVGIRTLHPPILADYGVKAGTGASAGWSDSSVRTASSPWPRPGASTTRCSTPRRPGCRPRSTRWRGGSCGSSSGHGGGCPG